MYSLYLLLITLLDLYSWIIFLYVVLSLLIQFSILNRLRHGLQHVADYLYRFLQLVVDYLYRFSRQLSEMTLRPVRRFLPSLGPFDLSPVVVLLLLFFLKNLLREYWPN